MKKKVIFSAMLSIALCFSLIAGSTMALFTSESKVNIAVSSGTVKVTASVSGLTLYSMGEEQTDVFANGGTATYDEATTTLTLENVTPGDKVTLNIDVKNESTVAIYYRVQTFIRGALGAYLKATATVDGAEQEITTSTGAWTFVAANAAIDSIPVSVELPENVENDAQDKTAIVTVSVQAVQANGIEALIPEGTKATPDTINEVMAAANEGDTIALTAGYYAEIVVAKPLTFVGEDGAVVGFMDFNAKDNCKVENVTFDASGAKKAYNKNTQSYGFYANVVGTGTDSQNAADGLTVQNCTFTGVPADANNYVPVTLYERGHNGYLKNLTVDGCTFETDAAYYVYGFYPGTGTHTITNNVFGTKETSVASESAVYLGSNQGSVVMTGNTFVNCNFIGTIHSEKYKNVTVTVENNDFVFTTAGTFTAVALRYYTAYGATVSVKNNKVNGVSIAFAAPYVTSGGYECFDVTVS